jgi:glycosyltransferase involved in cell wall biosynthesis
MNSKLEVCIIGSCNYQQFPNIEYGGIEASIENLCKGLYSHFQDTITFTVIVPKIIKNREATNTYGFNIVETEYVPMNVSNIYPTHFAEAAKNLILNSNIKPDVIWSVGHWSALILKDLNIPVITTIQDSGPWEDHKFINDSNITYRFISKFIYDLTFKDAARNEIVNNVKKRSTWFHVGFDDSEFIYQETKQNYILWVAGLGWGYEGKGLDKFIELAKRLPDEQFVAYGSGDDSLAQELINISKTIPNFQFKGTLNRGKEHIDAFRHAKLFLMLTSTSEAFGRTNIEALSKGTPVIGSTNGAVPELINHPGVGYCSNNINDIAIAIANYDFNPKICYEYAYDKYHIKKEIAQLISLSIKLINNT